MAVTVAGEKSTAMPSIHAGPLTYSLFGLRVQSDIRLPVPEDTEVLPLVDPDIVFAYCGVDDGTVAVGQLVSETCCNCPVHNGRVVMRVHRDEDGISIWNEDAGAFYIWKHGRQVDVYARSRNDRSERLLGLGLVGVASAHVLHCRGYPCLHASAVITEHGAIAFLGPKGLGKSTAAAIFLQHGGALLTDDILALRMEGQDVHAVPSLPIMKLWDQSVQHVLDILDELPGLVHGYDKKLVILGEQFAFADCPTRLRALYVLDRYDPVACGRRDVTILPRSSREGLMTLVAQTSLRHDLMPADIAELLPLYARLVAQAPMRVLRYPHGFEYKDVVHERILADLRERP